MQSAVLAMIDSVRPSVCLSVCPPALGHVTAALASAAPELDSTLINKLTDDKRSVVFDGAVRSVRSVRHSPAVLLTRTLEQGPGPGLGCQ